MFKAPRLCTVTVNREWHDSPESAHDHVMKGGFLRRLFRLMEVERWVWVMEAQEESGDGWPHWHVLIDVADLPGQWYNRGLQVATAQQPAGKAGWVFIPHFVDLNRVHALLARWEVGRQCKLTVRREGFESSAHAVNYITKYMIKMPRRGYPSWMLLRPRIRFAAASKEVGAVVAEPGSHEEHSKARCRETPLAMARVPVARLAECGQKLRLIQYDLGIDADILVATCRANREDVKSCPWSVTVHDLDFATGQSFERQGFRDQADAARFTGSCSSPQTEERWRQRVAIRAAILMAEWTAPRSRDRASLQGQRATALLSV